MSQRSLAIALTSLGVLSLLNPQLALASGADTYSAPVSAEDLLEVERAHAERGHLKPFARLSLTYAKDPLVLRNSDGTETKVVEHQAGVYGSLGISLWDRVQAAILVPLHFQSGQALPGEADPAGSAFGDLALDVRLAILKREDPLEVSVGGRLVMPTGNEDAFVGDGKPSFLGRATVSRAFGSDGSLITGSLGTSLRPGAGASGLDTGSEALLSLGGLVALTSSWGVTAEGALSSQFDQFLEGTTTPASLLGGLRYRADAWLAHLGAGPGVSQGLGTPDVRVVAMVGSAVSPTPPDEPVAIKPQDTDRDGILDPDDLCPRKAEDLDGYKDEDGCPELDNDKDGIPDSSDQCPSEPEDVDQFEDLDGCPETDNDKDGVADGADQCPIEPEDVDKFEDLDGCPEADNDKDGVADGADQCPTEKETPNGVEDADGCPDFLRVEQSQIRTLEPIYFEFGSARIQERSKPMLVEMAALITARDDLGRVAIEGHTDSEGSAAYNLRLSQERAQSVLDFIAQQGVPKERLSAAGFGEQRPIADNRTLAGRNQNRRVEFRIAGVTGAESKEEGNR